MFKDTENDTDINLSLMQLFLCICELVIDFLMCQQMPSTFKFRISRGLKSDYFKCLYLFGINSNFGSTRIYNKSN